MTNSLVLNKESGTRNAARGNLLANRNFRLLWIGEGISLIGDQFHLIALPWLVLSLTGNALTMGQASWTTLVVAELVGAVAGLGSILNQAGQDIFPTMILVGMISVALCGWLMTLGLGWIERLVMPWKAQA